MGKYAYSCNIFAFLCFSRAKTDKDKAIFAHAAKRRRVDYGAWSAYYKHLDIILVASANKPCARVGYGRHARVRNKRYVATCV